MGDESIFNVVIGTAGHIDHGKSTLVRALTGVDPDRLPEEKTRAMTIDLGFAPLVLPSGRKVGIIDVPGHERFVKNMVAGATGIDLALLVVAADDGVMPQTREHLEIMDLLGLEEGLCAITKIDLADPVLVELVDEEVAEHVEGTFLEEAPVHRVSGTTGEGVEELREALDGAIDRVGPHSVEGVFRMPVQRVFSVQGFGTVVTGVPLAGSVEVGDEVEVLPGERRGRIRNIQAYGEDVPRGRAGHSTALAVSGIDRDDVRRGNVVAAPGYYHGSTLLETRVVHLESRPDLLETHRTVRVHVGTSEVLGELVLLEDEALAPGEEGLAQLRLEEPVVVAPGDRFILRRESPMITIGGGDVLGITRYRLKAGKTFVIEQLEEKVDALEDPEAYVASVLHASGLEPLTTDELRVATRQPEDELRGHLASLRDAGEVREIGHGDLFVHREAFARARDAVREAVDAFFAEHPLRLYADKVDVRARVDAPDELFEAVLDDLAAAHEVEDLGRNRLAIVGREPDLSPAQAERKEALAEVYREAGFRPPRPAEASDEVGGTAEELEALAHLLTEEESLVRVEEDILFHREVFERAKSMLREAFAGSDELVSADFKERLGTSRKYAIPLLEHFDELGLTERRGNVRISRMGNGSGG